jgi:hypothetical protein
MYICFISAKYSSIPYIIFRKWKSLSLPSSGMRAAILPFLERSSICKQPNIFGKPFLQICLFLYMFQFIICVFVCTNKIILWPFSICLTFKYVSLPPSQHGNLYCLCGFSHMCGNKHMYFFKHISRQLL